MLTRLLKVLSAPPEGAPVIQDETGLLLLAGREKEGPF